jgi:hypothetical protein
MLHRRAVWPALAVALLATAASASGAPHARAHVVGSGITTTASVQVVGSGFRARVRYVVAVTPAAGSGSCSHHATRRTPPAGRGGTLQAVVTAPGGGWCADTEYTGRITRTVSAPRTLATFRFRVLALPPGTVSGTVLTEGCIIGPVEAVVIIPCRPPKPLQGAVLDFNDAKGRTVAAATSDVNGQFGVNLAPGTYMLTPQPFTGLTAPAPEPVTVTSAQHITGLTVTYRMLGLPPA